MSKPGSRLRVALAQINPTVGDIEGNATLIEGAIERAAAEGADLVVLPELCLPGYPAEDLYLKPHFVAENAAALTEIATRVRGISALVGFAEPAPVPAERGRDAPAPRQAYNSLALLVDGEVRAVYRKNRLPNYGVFDEVRYFEPGERPGLCEVAGVTLWLTICEDLWV
jgi:NAD+ synthase (glutamine-hydrolysing)